MYRYRHLRYDVHIVDTHDTIYYNMTVMILAGNEINFVIAAGLIRLHMPGGK